MVAKNSDFFYKKNVKKEYSQRMLFHDASFFSKGLNPLVV